ncbi:MAG: trigger factor [Acidobacteria bacterium]|nr:trigger factor [Acidobacteriota bacterium]
MKTELKEISPTQREIHIEIEADAVREVYNKVSKKYAKNASVPGFRKGLAPVDVIRLRYKEEIQNEVLRELLPDKVQQAIEEHELNPLSEPQLHFDNYDNLKLNGSAPLALHVHVEVMPEIPTPDYKGFEVTRRVRPVPEGEMNRIIDQRRQQGATLMPVEGRKSENGDTLIVDLEGVFVDDAEAEPIRADDLELTLGDGNIEPAFTDNLAGLEEDEEKEFTVTYPEDFSSIALAGKTVTYKAKVKSIGRVEMPELDDEWAQSLDEGYESLADLRSRLGSDLEKVTESDADAAVRNELVSQLIAKHDFEIPNALIDAQARNLLNNFAADMQQRGVDLNKVDKDFIQMAYSQMRTQAERDVRGALLLERIAELEGVEVSAEEIDNEIQMMADYYSVPVETIRQSLAGQQNGEANIANNLRTRKAVEAIFKHASVTDGEWIDPAQKTAEAAAAADEPEAADEPATAEETAADEAEKPKARTKKAKAENGENEDKPKKKPAKKDK